MRCRSPPSCLLLWVALLWTVGEAFVTTPGQVQSGSKRTLQTNDRSTPFWASNSDDDTDNNDEDDGGKATLNFLVELNLSSDPLPSDTTTEQVMAFLQDPDTKKLMLSAGGSREVVEVSMADIPELESLWEECCQEEYGVELLPGGDGDYYGVLSTVTETKLPGVKLNNKIFNGVKQFTDDETGLPKFTFMMVGEDQTASGPLVWIFNKLTGAGKKKDDESSLKPSGYASSDVSVVKDENGNMAFNYDATIKITVKFPAALMKILPTSKEKAEASASSSIAKGVQKDVEKGAKGVYDAFLEFQKQQ